MKKVYTVREGIIVEIASIRYPELCAKNHPPIIHSELACPLCEMQEEMGALRGGVDELKDKIYNYNSDNEDFQCVISDLKRVIADRKLL